MPKSSRRPRGPTKTKGAERAPETKLERRAPHVTRRGKGLVQPDDSVQPPKDRPLGIPRPASRDERGHRAGRRGTRSPRPAPAKRRKSP